MATQTHCNTSPHGRTWLSLKDPRTGATLSLGPGESVDDLDVPPDFTDPYLKPVAKRNREVVIPTPAGPVDAPTEPKE